MEIEKIPSIECGNCESMQITNVGWRVIEGYYCNKCNYYTDAKTGEISWVKNITERQTGFIFKNDIRLK